MTLPDIKRFIRGIPKDTLRGFGSNWLTTDFNGMSDQVEIAAEANLIMDPRFVWRFVKIFSDRKIPLPDDSSDFLFSIYNYQCGYTDNQLIREARLIDSPRLFFIRDIVDALLLSAAQTYESIAKICCLPIAILKTYEQLFWNVRDRIEEVGYIGHLAYPNHSLLACDPDYIHTVKVRDFLLQSALIGGADAMLPFAGIPRKISELNMQEDIMRYKGHAFRRGLDLARTSAGYSLAPALMAVTGMIRSMDESGQEQKSSDDVEGLGAVSAKYAVMETIRQQTEELDHMGQILQQAKAGLPSPESIAAKLTSPDNKAPVLKKWTGEYPDHVAPKPKRSIMGK